MSPTLHSVSNEVAEEIRQLADHGLQMRRILAWLEAPESAWPLLRAELLSRQNAWARSLCSADPEKAGQVGRYQGAVSELQLVMQLPDDLRAQVAANDEKIEELRNPVDSEDAENG